MPVKDLNPVSRGSFFDDPFFKDSWQDFDHAMQRVVGRFDTNDPDSGRDSGAPTPQPPSQSDQRTAYRQLRKDKMDNDLYASQAVQVTEMDGKFQAVIDVKDFNPRDLQVKVIDDRVVLEGRYDVVSEDGKSSTSKAFYREFTLPPEADIDLVATALSKDGVLTIKAPRKEGLPTPTPTPTQTPRQSDPYSQSQKLDHLRNIQNFIQNSQNAQSGGYDSTDSTYDSLPKDIKDRLLISDRDSGRSSGSGSPSCGSPAPSDAGSEASRVSSYSNAYNPHGAYRVKAPSTDISHSTHSPFTPMSPQSVQGMPLGSTSSISSLGSSSTIHEDAFRNTPTPSQTPQPTASWPPITPQQTPTPTPHPFSPTPSNASSTTYHTPPQHHNVAEYAAPRAPLARSSGGTATITVKEEDGKRVQTSETSSVVQEKDGYLESKEVASEFTGDGGQGASRQAKTRMMREEVDPSGRGKKSEKADASDVSESMVERRPDGSVVTTKKSSTSSTNFKQSFSTDPIFDSGFGDIRSLMGRGHSLMSQMSDDPFSDMTSSNMQSRMANMQSAFPSSRMTSNFPDFPDMEQSFPNRSMFSRPTQGNFPDRMEGFSSEFPSNFSSQNFSKNFNTEDKNEEEKVGPHGSAKTKTYSTSSVKSNFSSSFDNENRKF